MIRARVLFAWLVLASVGACAEGEKQRDAAAQVEATPIGISECAACGMVVREQPAPRAQLVHRDGTREYFCSVGDLAHYLLAPSPHGDATAVFVEVDDSPSPDRALEPNFDEGSWVRAESATFVVGIQRPNIMGIPALTFATRAQAEQAASKFGGDVMDWDGARAYLVRQISEPAHNH